MKINEEVKTIQVQINFQIRRFLILDEYFLYHKVNFTEFKKYSYISS